MRTLLALSILAALSTRLVADAPLVFKDSRSLPSEATGLTSVARTLASDHPSMSEYVIATVNNAATREANDVLPRKWNNGFTKTGMIDVPSRVTFELMVSAMGHAFDPGPLSAIEWSSDYADNWTESGKRGGFGHKFNHHRDAVMMRPLVNSTIICFTPPLIDQDGSLTKALNTLPKGSLGALAAAVAWRNDHDALFQPKATITENAIKVLRAEVANSNGYVRLSVLLHLIKLGNAGASDVIAALNAAMAPVESAAATLIVLTDAPDLVPSILVALGDPLANRLLLDGVVIGAATHFLNLADSEQLVSAARSFQIVRADSPTIPDKLAVTVSFPLLLKLADAVTAQDGIATVEPSSALYKMLRAAGALRR